MTVYQLYRLTETRYLSALVLLLGVSFQLSMAATNVFFYLLVVSGIVLTVLPAREQAADWRAVLQSPLWWVVTGWVGLLYVSAIYSEPNDLMWGYAKKYIKYTLVGFIVVLILSQRRLGVDLPKRFFLGFAIGGAITFILGVLNQSTGWLTQAAVQGWLPKKYVANDYWVSNELFAHSLFMAILFAYGLITYLRTQQWRHLLFCAVGLFGVFVVSDQRTGFIVALVVTLWLAWLLLPTLRQRQVMLFGVCVAIILTLLTSNGVSARIIQAMNEWQQCQAVIGSSDLQVLGGGCYNSIGLRLMFIRDSLAQIGDAWFLGHGLGNLQLPTLHYDWHNKHYSEGRLDNPHSEYLLQGLQLGFVGVLLLISLFVTAFWQAMLLNRSRRYLYAGIVLMYAVGCLFNSFLLDAMQGMLFTLLLAFIIVERCYQREAA